MQRPPTSGLEKGSILLVSALVATMGFGVLALWTPFTVDQALFAYGGRTIVSGDVLYQDFWDIKPPGIFLFYALGGWLFDFTEPGIHLLELAWQLALALVLVALVRVCVANRVAAALAPIASVGAYYALTEGRHLTQVEALVGLPLMLSLAAAFKLARNPRSAGWGILCGAMAGVVAAFKLLYVLVPLAFALLVVTDSIRRLGWESRGTVLRMIGWSALGFAVIWLPLVALFTAQGTLPELLWTLFGYPTEAFKGISSAPTRRLFVSARWFAKVLAPFAPFLLLGLTACRKPRQPILIYGIAAYLLLGTALILLQKLSWWQYHFVLLLPPLGFLASLGLDKLLELRRTDRTRAVLVGCLAGVLLAVPILYLARSAKTSIEVLAVARGRATEAPVSVRLDRDYLEIWEKTRFLHHGPSQPGPVYVFGDARILLLSGRRQAIAVHGHAWQHLPEVLWHRLPAELIAARPTYVFLTEFNRRTLRDRAPELLEFLETEYRPVRRIRQGRWLARKRS